MPAFSLALASAVTNAIQHVHELLVSQPRLNVFKELSDDYIIENCTTPEFNRIHREAATWFNSPARAYYSSDTLAVRLRRRMPTRVHLGEDFYCKYTEDDSTAKPSILDYEVTIAPSRQAFRPKVGVANVFRTDIPEKFTQHIGKLADDLIKPILITEAHRRIIKEVIHNKNVNSHSQVKAFLPNLDTIMHLDNNRYYGGAARKAIRNGKEKFKNVQPSKNPPYIGALEMLAKETNAFFLAASTLHGATEDPIPDIDTRVAFTLNYLDSNQRTLTTARHLDIKVFNDDGDEVLSL